MQARVHHCLSIPTLARLRGDLSGRLPLLHWPGCMPEHIREAAKAALGPWPHLPPYRPRGRGGRAPALTGPPPQGGTGGPPCLLPNSTRRDGSRAECLWSRRSAASRPCNRTADVRRLLPDSKGCPDAGSARLTEISAVAACWPETR
jgi:hypothetical protein